MPRIRSIKPEFFMHDGIAELSAMHRLLFIGLWTQADREGRLADRPVRIKATVLPYDKADVDGMLADLASHRERFITRYEAEGEKYIQINRFREHQYPHIKEPESEIPPAPYEYGAGTIQEPVEPACNMVSGNMVSGNMVSGSADARASTKPGKRVPLDFVLTDDLRAFAMGRGLEAAAVAEEWDKFRDHQFRDARSDWAATWRTWVRNAVKFRERDGATVHQRAAPITAAGRTMQSIGIAFGNDDEGEEVADGKTTHTA